MLSAGDGYRYYVDSVAVGDEGRAAGQQMSDYYLASGNPEGVWMGAGVARLGLEGEQVTERQMELLYGMGKHPNPQMLAEGESDRLGRPFYQYQQPEGALRRQVRERIAGEERRLGRKTTVDEKRQLKFAVAARMFRDAHGGREPKNREEFARFIQQQEKPGQQAVSAFDHTFSPAKSVSVLWALSDDETKKKIENAHTRAIESTVRRLESEYLFTRAGHNGLRTVNTEGSVATRFRHYDNRNGEPQLHDHVVVANKVWSQERGGWLTVDSQTLLAATVELSEHYNKAVMDNLSADLGLATRLRTQGVKAPVREIAGISDELIDAASTRRLGIKEAVEQLKAEFLADHGYAPSPKQQRQLAQQATLMTRSEKDPAKPLRQKVAEWQQNLGRLVDGPSALENARRAAREQQTLHGPADVRRIADEVIERLESRRSVYKKTHIDAEITRATSGGHQGHQVTEADRAQIAEQVMGRSLSLTPEERWAPLPGLTRKDGSSVYERPGRELFTTQKVIDSEASMIAAVHQEIIPVAANELFDKVLATASADQFVHLNAAQINLARHFVTDEHAVSVGLGPAGTGKTTSLRLAGAVVEAAGGTVYGVAPSAAAAAVLSDDLGVKAETIDKLVLEWRNGRGPDLKAGDLLIVDEAGMSSTPNLAAVIDEAARRGVKVDLIGDDAQLSAVGAGGAFRSLTREVEPARLEEVHRFRHEDGTVNEAEAAASLALREPPTSGVDKPFAWYLDEGRITAGDQELMTSLVYENWQKDTLAGKESIMAAFDNATVADLNGRAQAFRIAREEINANGPSVQLSDGHNAFIGDTIVSRQNERKLTLSQGRDHVRNGYVWTVEGIDDKGRVRARHHGSNAVKTLPAAYVRERAELGYASTVHRTQGRTVDTIHTVMDSQMSRSLAYVAMTRGRYENKAYVALREGEDLNLSLEKIAANHDRNFTAHELASLERGSSRSAADAAAQLEDILTHIDSQRAAHALREIAGPDAREFTTTASWEAVGYWFREAANNGFDPQAILSEAYRQREFGSADDHSAVLAWRMEDALTRAHEARDAAARRPFAQIPDEHLGRLAALARKRAGDLARDAAAAETPTWAQRPLGHWTDERLATRLEELESSATSGVGEHEKNQWTAARVAEEIDTRAAMDPAQAQQERYMRGLYGGRAGGRTPAADVRAARERSIAAKLTQEQALRRLVPTNLPEQTRTRREARVPEWLVRRDTLAYLPGAGKPHTRQVKARLHDLQENLVETGTRVAAEKPAWAAELGEVPSQRRRAYDWYRTAGEVAAFRQKYGVPETEPNAIPAKLAKGSAAEELRAKITAVHKYQAQTSKPAATDETTQRHAEQAERRRQAVEKKTPAEKRINDSLRRRLDKLAQRRKDMSSLQEQQKPASAERVQQIKREQQQRERDRRARRDDSADLRRETGRRGPQL